MLGRHRAFAGVSASAAGSGWEGRGRGEGWGQRRRGGAVTGKGGRGDARTSSGYSKGGYSSSSCARCLAQYRGIARRAESVAGEGGARGPANARGARGENARGAARRAGGSRRASAARSLSAGEKRARPSVATARRDGGCRDGFPVGTTETTRVLCWWRVRARLLVEIPALRPVRRRLVRAREPFASRGDGRSPRRAPAAVMTELSQVRLATPARVSAPSPPPRFLLFPRRRPRPSSMSTLPRVGRPPPDPEPHASPPPPAPPPSPRPTRQGGAPQPLGQDVRASQDGRAGGGARRARVRLDSGRRRRVVARAGRPPGRPHARVRGERAGEPQEGRPHRPRRRHRRPRRAGGHGGGRPRSRRTPLAARARPLAGRARRARGVRRRRRARAVLRVRGDVQRRQGGADGDPDGSRRRVLARRVRRAVRPGRRLGRERAERVALTRPAREGRRERGRGALAERGVI